MTGDAFKVPKTSPKRRKINLIIIGIFVVLALFILLLPDANTPKTAPAAALPTPELTPEQVLTKRIKDQFSPSDGSHFEFSKVIKKQLNNPKSFEHVETLYAISDDKTEILLKMTFRGTNVFGAVVTNSAHGKAKIETGEVTSAVIDE